jgi:dipeptidase D
MSPDFPGLVETSTSLDEVITAGTKLTLDHLSRSSNDSLLPDVIEALTAAAHLAGGELSVGQADPGWRPNLDSRLLAVSRRVYERLFGKAAAVTAVHAWLETAVIGDRVGGLDMISFGPQIEAPHSPDERVNIPTVERFWQLLISIVQELSSSERRSATELR